MICERCGGENDIHFPSCVRYRPLIGNRQITRFSPKSFDFGNVECGWTPSLADFTTEKIAADADAQIKLQSTAFLPKPCVSGEMQKLKEVCAALAADGWAYQLIIDNSTLEKTTISVSAHLQWYKGAEMKTDAEYSEAVREMAEKLYGKS